MSPASLWMLIAAPFDQNLPAWFLSWGVLAVTTALVWRSARRRIGGEQALTVC